MLKNNQNANFQIHCPTSHCSGWVCFIDGFYGCGECGNVWFSKADLDQAIDEIIQQYAHRRQVYQKIDNSYQPLENEPSSYNALVETEIW